MCIGRQDGLPPSSWSSNKLVASMLIKLLLAAQRLHSVKNIEYTRPLPPDASVFNLLRQPPRRCSHCCFASRQLQTRRLWRASSAAGAPQAAWRKTLQAPTTQTPNQAQPASQLQQETASVIGEQQQLQALWRCDRRATKCCQPSPSRPCANNPPCRVASVAASPMTFEGGRCANLPLPTLIPSKAIITAGGSTSTTQPAHHAGEAAVREPSVREQSLVQQQANVRTLHACRKPHPPPEQIAAASIATGAS
jgi:hypothetical protein